MLQPWFRSNKEQLELMDMLAKLWPLVRNTKPQQVVSLWQWYNLQNFSGITCWAENLWLSQFKKRWCVCTVSKIPKKWLHHGSEKRGELTSKWKKCRESIISCGWLSIASAKQSEWKNNFVLILTKSHTGCQVSSYYTQHPLQAIDQKTWNKQKQDKNLAKVFDGQLRGSKENLHWNKSYGEKFWVSVQEQKFSEKWTDWCWYWTSTYKFSISWISLHGAFRCIITVSECAIGVFPARDGTWFARLGWELWKLRQKEKKRAHQKHRHFRTTWQTSHPIWQRSWYVMVLLHVFEGCQCSLMIGE